ncbi:uncharacterized protein B0P05DRAFT_448789, partial [Gilbertella persicaria]|uniref:uncharacterized protein n=1 Tax=Gilbertella persicaria TaxID=101096 RepID=UPI002220A059
LEKEEKEYQFEAIPRRNAIYLRGVDEMSTADITSYANTPLLQKVQWINDSSCNLVFDNEEQAMEVAQTLLHEPTASLDHHTLLPAKPFTHNDRSFELFIRVATDEDVKEKGARAKSRYYMIHGTDDEPLTSERKEVRKEHVERMSKNGGDGRDVFSRL